MTRTTRTLREDLNIFMLVLHEFLLELEMFQTEVV